jgi:DNA integrity scanning protein DisA with diadenylate cyclase activity
VRDAIKNFAVLDGAFVIREAGVVLAASRCLTFDEAKDFRVPLGLGGRPICGPRSMVSSPPSSPRTTTRP